MSLNPGMIILILLPTVPTALPTALFTIPTCGRAGMDGGIHSGFTGTTTIIVVTIPISGAGIRPDREAGTPAKQPSRKDS